MTKLENYIFYSKNSFDDIERYWINEVENYAEKNVELLLIGNKADNRDAKVVSTQFSDGKREYF